jgi:hypothetical protein
VTGPAGRIPAVLSLGLLVATPGLGAAKQPLPAGTIGLETANRIVGDYARHVLSQLPRGLREQQEKRWRDDPPRLDPGGIYQLGGPAGRIAFEHDAENRRLLCWAVIHKMRREYPLVGLTREEILAALERAAAGGMGTGGGEVAYEPISDGFFLLRAYGRPPGSVRRMARELDRLTAAGEKWTRKHYLDAVVDYAETLRPPASATARDGGFEVTLVLTPDVRYHDLWHRPPGAVQPLLVSRAEYRRGQEVWAMALFSGATAGDDGSARFEAQYSFVYPNGEEAGSKVFMFWEGPPPPADHLQMVEERAAIELGPDKLLGDYLARVKVRNVTTQRCVTAESPFRVLAESGS